MDRVLAGRPQFEDSAALPAGALSSAPGSRGYAGMCGAVVCLLAVHCRAQRIHLRAARRRRLADASPVPLRAPEPEAEDADSGPDSELEAMMSELREIGSARLAKNERPEEPEDAEDFEDGEETFASVDDFNYTGIIRSGQICVLGVPNAGKSSLVNALVGAKISIVSPKPQTTRQKVLGLALVGPEIGAAPTTQAVFLDTPGIMSLKKASNPLGSPSKRQALSTIIRKSPLHKAMVKTAWQSATASDVLFWVLDASKCCFYGNNMPARAMLDGVPIGPLVRDAWWTHPDMQEELALMRRIRKLKQPVHVILNKMDLVEAEGVNASAFAALIRQQLDIDIGPDDEGRPLFQGCWPTSVVDDPDSLWPIRKWLCENLPVRKPMYPLEAISDVPARVAASEITREALFKCLDQELPYCTAVINAVWREDPDGTLELGQRIICAKPKHEVVVRSKLKKITEDVEREISEAINFGQRVRLFFQTVVDPDWQEKEEYYKDVQGLLGTDSLMFEK